MSKSMSSSAPARPRIRGIEIVIYVVLVFSLFIVAYNHLRVWFSLFASLAGITYLIGGYFFIIKIKGFLWSNIIAAFTGIFFSSALLFAMRRMYRPLDDALYCYLPFIFIVLLFIISLVLYFRLKGNDAKQIFFKTQVIRTFATSVFFLPIFFLPTKVFTELILGTESNLYIEILQREAMTDARKFDNLNDYESGLSLSLDAIKYSHLRKDTSSYLYQATLNLAGLNYERIHEYRKADSLFDKVIDINKNKNCYDENEFNYAIYYKGILYNKWGAYSMSDSLLHISASYFTDNSNLGSINYRFAKNANGLGKYNEADSLINISLKYYEEGNLKGLFEYLSIISLKASNKADLGKIDEARELLDEALSVANINFGKESLESVNIMEQYIDFLILTANYKKAEELCNSVINAKKKSNKKYLWNLVDLASIKLAMCDYKEARKILDDVLLGNNTGIRLQARIFHYLSLIEKDYQNLEMAESYAQKSFDFIIKEYGDHTLATGKSLEDIAYIKYLRGKYKESDTLYLKAFNMIAYYTGRESVECAKVKNGIALICLEKKELDLAERLFDQSLSVLKSKLGEQNPNCGVVLYNKSDFYLMKDDYYNSRDLLNQSMKIFTSTYGSKHKLIADNYLALAELDMKEKSVSSALNNYTAARNMYSVIFGKDYYLLPTLDNKILNLKKKV